MNLILTGFMGTGKSAVGEVLAQRLKMDFIDTDTLIEEKAGLGIAEIFSRHGEARFREWEKETVLSLAGCRDKVVAIGGGTIVDGENLQGLRKIGPIVCLTATAETIYDRIRSETHRPLLKVPDPVSRIRRLLEERDPYYARADYHFPTDGKTVEIVVDNIMAKIEKLYR